MKRCEREWTPARAEGVQAVVKELCGFCPCESGIPCPLFERRPARADEAVRDRGSIRKSA